MVEMLAGLEGVVEESEDVDGGLDIDMYGIWIKALMICMDGGLYCYIYCELLSKWSN